MLRRTPRAWIQLALAGQRLTRADLRWPSVATVDLVGATVLGTAPYGKHLLTRFDDGRTLHTHLRMDGTGASARTGTREAAARSPDVRAVLGHRRVDRGRPPPGHGRRGRAPPGRAHAHRPPRARTSSGRTSTSTRPCGGGRPRGCHAGGGGAARPARRRRDRHDLHRGVAVRRAHLAVDPGRRRRRTRRGCSPSPAGRCSALSPTGRPPGHVHGRLRQPCHRCGTQIEVRQARKPPTERPIFYCPRCQAPRD